MIRTALLASFVVLGVWADAGAQTIITGTVKSKAGQPLPGLALLEKGEIHNNRWDRGGLVGPDGRFRIEVTGGGPYGLHVYSSGYIYSPNAIKVESGKTLEMNIVLVPEPTRANDPVIQKIGFAPGAARQGKASLVTADVTDPNNDLGPQVLAFNAATGRAYAMDPPSRVRNLKANYPNGTYRLEADTAAAPLDPKAWHFVVADHQCNTTDILSFPHERKEPQVIR
jgi:hypothetical protein